MLLIPNKKNFVVLLISFGLLILSTRPSFAKSPSPVPGPDPATLQDIVPILRNIISFLAPAAGIAFFIMLLVGGYQFLTSGGDPKAAGGARNTLTFAVIGIILVVASWLILKLVAQITGADVTTVTFPAP